MRTQFQIKTHRLTQLLMQRLLTAVYNRDLITLADVFNLSEYFFISKHNMCTLEKSTMRLGQM